MSDDVQGGVQEVERGWVPGPTPFEQSLTNCEDMLTIMLAEQTFVDGAKVEAAHERLRTQGILTE